MTGARGEAKAFSPLRAAMSHLGLDAEDLLVIPGPPPPKLESSHLHPSSYIPDFTTLVQRLLQLRRPGGTLSIALCGPPGDAASRTSAAMQLAIGFTQHGLQTVLVDGEFSQPGLSGLLADPYQEGLVDMVRFGRSCRSLLGQPVPGGPHLLGTGSFPLRGREPFESEAWRGIVHRVALHGELIVYVVPLVVDRAENPVLEAVDQVVYVTSEAGQAEADVQRLRHSTARIAAVVAFAAAGAPVEPEPVHAPPARSEPPAPEALAGPSVPVAEPGRLPDAEIAAFVEGALPETEPEPAPHAVSETPAVPPAPAVRSAPAAPEPEMTRAAAFSEEPPEEPREPPTAVEPRKDHFFPPPDAAPRPDEAVRPAEEAADLRRKLGLDEEEFSYSSPARYSRVPLFLFLVLLATISGFIGWTLWQSHTGGRRPLRVPPETTTQAAPPAPAPDGTQPPASDERDTPPSGAVPGQQGVTEPDDMAAQNANAAGGPGAEPGATPGASVQGPSGATNTPHDATPPPSGASTPPPEQAPTGNGSTSPERAAPGGESSQEPAREAPPPAGPVYAVHVASYRRMEQANEEIANLHKLGYEGRARRTDLGSKGIWFRVLVGSYSNKEEAEAAREVILKLPGYAFAQVRRVTEP